MLANPSMYSAKFLSHWETFADELMAAPQLPAADGDGPLATEQNRCVVELMAVAELLYQLRQPERAARFQRVAQAFQDHAEGIPNALFGIGKPTGRAGRRPDPSEVWIVRAEVCLGLDFMVAGGMHLEDAVTHVCARHGTKLKWLLRPGTNLNSSMISWHDSISTEAAANIFALDAYKVGKQMLKWTSSELPAAELRRLGERLVKAAARRCESFTLT